MSDRPQTPEGGESKARPTLDEMRASRDESRDLERRMEKRAREIARENGAPAALWGMFLTQAYMESFPVPTEGADHA